MKVLAICGLPGSGKTTAIGAINDLGYVITMGDVVRNEAKLRNLEYSGKNLGIIAKELRKIGGSDIIAIKCVELIRSEIRNVVFVDGVRSLSEVNIFRKFWKFPLIAIVVNEEVRFERLFKRNRNDDPKNLFELKKRDKREIDFGLENLIKNADYVIVNDSNKEILKKNTRETVLKILQTY